MKRILLTIASLTGIALVVVSQLATASTLRAVLSSLAAAPDCPRITIHQADESEPIRNVPFPERRHKSLGDIRVLPTPVRP
ncbi:hypothetical protein ACFPMF_19740 [Larkinella bovis]|uniref:Uncharacterized protein n=1 Tax=Larkinella bovis TaxID=683041 RepID=A0ABW0IFP0_9BACT